MRSRFNAQQHRIWVSCEAKDADIATDIGHDRESAHIPEHRGDIREIPVCAGDRLVLRAVDVDGAWRMTKVV